MNGLRYFSDLMNEAIEKDNRIKRIESNAERYAGLCQAVRAEHGPVTDRTTLAYRQASEGLAAIRIIFAGDEAAQ